MIISKEILQKRINDGHCCICQLKISKTSVGDFKTVKSFDNETDIQICRKHPSC